MTDRPPRVPDAPETHETAPGVPATGGDSADADGDACCGPDGCTCGARDGTGDRARSADSTGEDVEPDGERPR